MLYACCVDSAQSQGLLCEVPRSAKDDNVKYIGYCSYHYKKMVSLTAFCICVHVCFILHFLHTHYRLTALCLGLPG